MKEELDSQLSAMFDDELPPAECELLARRLSRDEHLKARWGRYAVIGATIRAEGGTRLNGEVARRVSVRISAEPQIPSKLIVVPKSASSRWLRPLAGGAVAASVAAACILWLRSQTGPQEMPLLAQSDGSGGSVALASSGDNASAGSSASYVVPRVAPRAAIVPATQFANYVVAHSEFSSPVTRRNLLSALVANETGTAGPSSGSEEPIEDPDDNGKSAQ